MVMNKGHSKSLDWYNFGIVLYELIVGSCPYNDKDKNKLFAKIMTDELTFPSHVSD